MMVVMLHFFTRIGIVFLVACVVTVGAVADDDYVYPPGAEPPPPEAYTQPLFGQPIPPHLYDEITVLDLDLKRAYDTYQGTYLEADPIEAVNDLRMFVLSKRLDKVRENLDWAITQGWDEDFIDIFRRSIEWGDHIWHSDGAYVWKQSKIEEDRSPHKSHNHVRFWLESVARDKQYTPAQYDYIQKEYLNPKAHFFDVKQARWMLSDLGARNFEPAIQQLIENFITGAQWPKHAGAAYFWFKHGEDLGFDLSPWRPRIEQLVSEQDHLWAQSFRDQGEVPQSWDLK